MAQLQSMLAVRDEGLVEQAKTTAAAEAEVEKLRAQVRVY